MLYSPEDHELLSQYTWSRKGKDGCCIGKMEDGKIMRMHRFIMGNPPGKIVDHINSNNLDNRRENLRITDSVGNGQNKKKMDGTSSKYMGVTKTKSGTWRAIVVVKGTNHRIGTFKKEIEAAKARDTYIVQKLPGSLFKLNFPNDKEKYLKYVLKPVKQKPRKQASPLVKTFYEDIEGKPDIVRLIIDSNPDIFVTIDREDYDKIKHFKCGESDGYITIARRRLYRYLLNETDPAIIIDHIDRNPHNNTKANLRRSTPVKNSQNRTKTKIPTSSRYIGVSFSKERKKWKACLHLNGKNIFIGWFDTEKEAALKRDFYIIQNLPDSHFTLNCLVQIPFPDIK